MNFADQLRAQVQANLERSAEAYLELVKRELGPSRKALADSLRIVKDGDKVYIGSSLDWALKAELDKPYLRKALLVWSDELGRLAARN